MENTEASQEITGDGPRTTSNARSSSNRRQKKTIYLVRHAEATHNVKEKEAVAAAMAAGFNSKTQLDLARKAVIQDDSSLVDAPLSNGGIEQVKASAERLSMLLHKNPRYQKPKIVLTSPLRRALMTAMNLFGGADFVSLEALREKRTGGPCDERCTVAEKWENYHGVDFSDLEDAERGIRSSILSPVLKGEDNAAVRLRVAAFLDNYLPHVEQDILAVVSHKGWLRELRNVLKERQDKDPSKLRLEFDIDAWHLTLFTNAELRVAEFEWDEDGKLISVVSMSLDNAIEEELVV